tara:strand:+ start:250 stop:555 length:306 start_codon:yes stop_codon:yes gene_type:complete
MTTNEAIKAIKDYLRYSNVSENQFNDIVFQDEEATLNGKTIFTFDYDNGGMDLYTLDGDNICDLDMKTLVELFHDLYYKVYCQDCNGSHEDCDHDGVIYPL